MKGVKAMVTIPEELLIGLWTETSPRRKYPHIDFFPDF